ncbi:hypothetical protein DFH29DRAFT_1049093 [Suillus ampliporus]|nr:hypothetical protein DFH29DRAFT_1049093 [Suillus ampliporus]
MANITTTESRIPRYQLRDTCACKGTTKKTIETTIKEVIPLRVNSESAISSLVSSPGEPQPQAVSPAYSARQHARSYSDVLMAHNPLMPGALREMPARPLNETAETTKENPGGKTSVDATTSVSRDNEETEKNTHSETPGRSWSVKGSEDDGEDQSGIWTTVERKRTAGTKDVTRKKGEHQDLTPEQENLVRKTKNKLTRAEKERIKTRWNTPSRPALDGSESEESPGEGPSRSKGKAPDPRNWGGADLDDDDLDMEAQRAALNSYCTAKYKDTHNLNRREIPDEAMVSRVEAEAAVRAAEERVQRHYEARFQEMRNERTYHLRGTESDLETLDISPKKKQGKTRAMGRDKDPVRTLVDHTLERSTDPRERWQTPKAMDPARQVALKSYIGQALGRLDKQHDKSNKRT